MQEADHIGPGSNTGSGNGAATVTRYIITRPCLAEGSLRLLKYLQPLFPAEGPVTLQDGRGERFAVNVELARGRLTGLGELYRAHNLGVNDVLLLSRAEEGRYRVECVVKPHARPQTGAPERPAPAPLTTEKRVVIHATPHVREVRVERVPVGSEVPGHLQAIRNAAPLGLSRTAENHRPKASGPRHTAEPDSAAPDFRSAASLDPATAAIRPTSPAELQQQAAPPSTTVKPSRAEPGSAATDKATPGQPKGSHNTGRMPAPGSPTPLTALTARMQPSAAPIRVIPTLSVPIQMNFPVTEVRPSAPSAAGPFRSSSTGAVTGPARPTVQPPAAQPVVPAASVTATATETAQPDLRTATDAEAFHNPEDQLAALARLTGYTCDHLGSGVVRLRAELGSHSYSVLIATTPQALTTPAWRESCDYMALLTPERERPQGIPRFTYSALEALLEHAGTAPLSPIDLRGYWNTGSFDHESASSVAELVKAQLTQRQNFSHVIETLAQQPAHSLVHLPRLAERLGSGVNTTELHGILETLSRAPFLALTPLPNGQYYLRSEVRDLVQEFGAYAESMQRRLRPAHGAGAAHQ